MKRIKLPLKGLSLFANVGIAEAYIKKYVHIKVANELVEKRAKFYSELYPSTNMICGNILDNTIFDKIIRSSLREKM